ncbi:MAG TPA: TIGR03619 family F420-dependent LLM class oxidoreductase [Anaerolineales bacterium]
MICSVGLPTCMEGMMYPVPFATPDQVIEIALWAEKLGYHSVWGNDHMTTQKYVREKFSQPPNFWEPLITYSFIAAQTTRLKFGTGLLVLPMRRDIVVAAKQIATFDQFSRGRVMIAVGVGAYREEFEALQPNWKVQRGELLEEGVQALRVLFTERNASWHGKYLEFENVEMYPKPYQDPLPIYFGGNNPNQVRRAAQYGQGWMPAGMPLEQLRKLIVQLKESAAQFGRAGEQLAIAPQFICCIGKTHEEAVERFRDSQLYEHLLSLRGSTLKDQKDINMEETNLVGSVQEVIEKAKRLGEAGATHLCGTYYCANSVAELKDQMQIFAEGVMPQL